MFTGIVEEVGRVVSVHRDAKNAFVEILAEKVTADVKLGDSIAVNGVCLTVVRTDRHGFIADVMNETLNRSNLGKLRAGSGVNLERAMPADGRFGGHIVSGHVDGTGIVSHMKEDGNAKWIGIKANETILKYIIEKGSVCIDGISLTVAKRTPDSFEVSIIPHTMQATTLSRAGVGTVVNLENDIVGKYIEHFISQPEAKSITEAFLANAGF